MNDSPERSPFSFAHEDKLTRRDRGAIAGEIDARLTVMCRGSRRLLLVGMGEPAPLAGTFRGGDLYLEGATVVVRVGSREGMSTIRQVELRLHCDVHPVGHHVDAGALREQLRTKVARCKVSEIERFDKQDDYL